MFDRRCGKLAAVLVCLALGAAALPSGAFAIGGPSGSGDASSAQYAPFLGGRGGRLRGPYQPPILNDQSPDAFKGWLLVPEVIGLILLGGASLASLRARISK